MLIATTGRKFHSPSTLRELVSHHYQLPRRLSILMEMSAVPACAIRGARIADAYEALRHRPRNAFVQASYKQFAIEVKEQFDLAITELEVTIRPWLKDGQPYANSKEMCADVFNNQHLYFFRTEAGYGEDCDLDNPLTRPTNCIIDGHRLLYNDMFRAIHDLFGHAMEEFSFGKQGEENAWLAHSRMFSPLARPALTTETRGQVSWFWYGPHLRNEDGSLPGPKDPNWIKPSKREYAEQKASLMGANFSGVQLLKDIKSGHIYGVPLKDWSEQSALRH